MRPRSAPMDANSWRLRSAFAVCLVAVCACQAPTTTVDATESLETTITFTVVGDAPVIEPDDHGAAYLLPGAAVMHEGTYHLYPVAFYADPTETPRVLHLTSEDGSSWTGDRSASVLEDFAIELDDVGAVPSAVFIDDDGTWVMYGGGRLPGRTDPIVWRATAPGPDGPWTAHPAPVLEPDGEGWDGAITDHPSVVSTGDGYVMAYGGASLAQPNRNRIGMATSTDGVTWTRMAATLDGADDDEALGPSACGIAARTMFEPHLIASEGSHLLLFGVMLEGEDDAMQVLAATSSDGVEWTCPPDQDAISSEDFPDAPGLHSFVAFEDGGTTLLLVEVLGEASSALWLARAADLREMGSRPGSAPPAPRSAREDKISCAGQPAAPGYTRSPRRARHVLSGQVGAGASMSSLYSGADPMSLVGPLDGAHRLA